MMLVSPPKPHFFQPLLPDFLTNFSIPKGFLKHLREAELDEQDGANLKTAILRDRRGRRWNVGVLCDELRFLCGWDKFCQDLDLQVGYFLVFRHQSALIFDVHIYDHSTCEREFPAILDDEFTASTKISDNSSTADFNNGCLEKTVDKEQVILNHEPEVKRRCTNSNNSRVSKDSSSSTTNDENGCLQKTGDGEQTILDDEVQAKANSSKLRISQNSSAIAYIEKGCLETMGDKEQTILDSESCANIKCATSNNPRISSNSPTTEGCLEKMKDKEQAIHVDEFQTRTTDSSYKGISMNSFATTYIEKGCPEKMGDDEQSKRKAPFKPSGYPYFHVIIKRYCFNCGSCFIPMKFGKKHGLRKRWCGMEIIDEEGKKWSLKLRHMHMSRRNGGSPYICGGWSAFLKAHNLNGGDHIILELLDSGVKPILKFYNCNGDCPSPDAGEEMLKANRPRKPRKQKYLSKLYSTAT